MNVRRPEFSVIVPAFNAETTISSAVSSALSQTRTELEVIVVDDGSTDGTAAALENVLDPRVRVVSQPNRGLPAARNAGIALARGAYVGFLDSDDLWLPRYLELAEQALKSIDRPGFAFATDAYAFNPTSGKVRPLPWFGRPSTDKHEFLLDLLERNFVYVSAVVPSRVLDEVGGFDESLNAAEDYELWLRIYLRGYRVAWIPGKHALYRVHDRQMSGDETRMRRAELAVLATIGEEDMPTATHREVLARRRRDLAREIRILEGRAMVASPLRRLRRRLGRVRRRTGLGENWQGTIPADVAADYPDLTAI